VQRRSAHAARPATGKIAKLRVVRRERAIARGTKLARAISRTRVRRLASA
jgi:hypothetical protein